MSHIRQGISAEEMEVYIKVSKSQKHFFLKLHCPKNERNIRQNSVLALSSFIRAEFRSFFGQWGFKKKCF